MLLHIVTVATKALIETVLPIGVPAKLLRCDMLDPSSMVHANGCYVPLMCSRFLYSQPPVPQR